MVNPDIALLPKKPGHEFGNTCFEELLATTVCVEEVVSGDIKQKVDPDVQQPLINVQLPLSLDRLSEMQLQDKRCGELCNCLATGDLDQNVYFVEDRILRHKLIDNQQQFNAIVLPNSLIDPVLVLAHDQAGHTCFPRTYVAIHRLSY